MVGVEDNIKTIVIQSSEDLNTLKSLIFTKTVWTVLP